jgi:hypothetical protein
MLSVAMKPYLLCRYTECQYSECRGAIIYYFKKFFVTECLENPDECTIKLHARVIIW